MKKSGYKDRIFYFNIYDKSKYFIMKYLKTFNESLSTGMLNDILDKISEFGIDSLSDYEKNC